jgi:hypothetical protein
LEQQGRLLTCCFDKSIEFLSSFNVFSIPNTLQSGDTANHSQNNEGSTSSSVPDLTCAVGVLIRIPNISQTSVKDLSPKLSNGIELKNEEISDPELLESWRNTIPIRAVELMLPVL